jgi:hypothetical protein
MTMLSAYYCKIKILVSYEVLVGSSFIPMCRLFPACKSLARCPRRRRNVIRHKMAPRRRAGLSVTVKRETVRRCGGAGGGVEMILTPFAPS